MLEISKIFPKHMSSLILKHELEGLEEIRIRANRQILLKFCNKEVIINYFVSQDEILQILQIICDNSIYSYQSQICNGFITIKRTDIGYGISGDVVLEDGKVKNISHIYSLNFRIANQIDGASKEILEYIIDFDKQTIFNSLIVGPPCSGKTTIIRDLAKTLSNGNQKLRGMTIGIVDERNELSAMYRGIPQNDLGPRTDILNNVKKSIGIEMLVRSMAPQVIIADEIGNEEDISSIKYALTSGVKGIFTAHGENYEDLRQNPIFAKMINLKLFKKIIFLDRFEKGKVKNVIYN